ncbi:DUF4019 domain-containing protein [Undibacterium aquatile]|uniref:DUF4019 domain-containing protein n=1 Tax=Undibacterium aquatile TaxID=1537398 RepID=A0ABR6XBN7_9BURK|nr:DUF4019 domain-containing protein [Undibacterium aquatile]MBC3810133.1 DUF4019 domain-containing protein [Undibacterium aquatile]
MKFITVAAFAVGMLSLSSVYAQKTDSVALAQTAATQWLELVDGGDYAASWDQAGSVFKGMVEKSKWLDAIQGIRSPLGAAKFRKVKSADYKKNIQGAPEGEYVTVQFETTFENKNGAIEVVTPMKDKDGTWRVTGYFVH